MEGEEERMEDQPIGKMAYGDLEIPGEYMVKEDDGIIHIKIISETFLTVKVRKFILNGSKDNHRKFVDYIKEKKEVIDVLEHIVYDEPEVKGMPDEK